MTKYYDKEYDRVVTEDFIKQQFEKFCEYKWFTKSYFDFLTENFIPVEDKNIYTVDDKEKVTLKLEDYFKGKTGKEVLKMLGITNADKFKNISVKYQPQNVVQAFLDVKADNVYFICTVTQMIGFVVYTVDWCDNQGECQYVEGFNINRPNILYVDA